MNKKALAGNAVIWIIIIVIVLFVMGFIVTVINGTITKILDTKDLKFYPIAERILYSEKCFALDENGRVYPGIISASRFNQESINNCMQVSNKPTGAKIELSYNKKYETIYYNGETYEDISPLTFSNLYESVRKRYYVLVEEKGVYYPGNLLIQAIWRK